MRKGERYYHTKKVSLTFIDRLVHLLARRCQGLWNALYCVPGRCHSSLRTEHAAGSKLGSWHGLAIGTVVMSLPPTVEFSLAHS